MTIDDFSYYREIADCEEKISHLRKVQDNVLDNKQFLTKEQISHFLIWSEKIINEWDKLKEKIDEVNRTI
jgi:hypothetical protein